MADDLTIHSWIVCGLDVRKVYRRSNQESRLNELLLRLEFLDDPSLIADTANSELRHLDSLMTERELRDFRQFRVAITEVTAPVSRFWVLGSCVVCALHTYAFIHPSKFVAGLRPDQLTRDFLLSNLKPTELVVMALRYGYPYAVVTQPQGTYYWYCKNRDAVLYSEGFQ